MYLYILHLLHQFITNSSLLWNTNRKRSELIIRSFNISDTGRYECRAKNKINQEPDRRTILIKADPGE